MVCRFKGRLGKKDEGGNFEGLLISWDTIYVCVEASGNSSEELKNALPLPLNP